jgi:hypothetical protein
MSTAIRKNPLPSNDDDDEDQSLIAHEQGHHLQQNRKKSLATISSDAVNTNRLLMPDHRFW